MEAIADRAHLVVGTVYQHFRSKRHLLCCLMDDLLDCLSRTDVEFKPTSDRYTAVRGLFAPAVAANGEYVGALRAWQEAALADPQLAHKDAEIHGWMTARILRVLELLHKLPRARSNVDLLRLATLFEALFWRQRTFAMQSSDLE